MVGVEYIVTYDRAYALQKDKYIQLKTIRAKMVNDYPSKYVFENEFGRYVFPHNAIHNMYPVDEDCTMKEKEVANNTCLDRFLNGEICVRCNGDEKYEFLKILDNTDCTWSDCSKPSEKQNVPYENFNVVYFGCIECAKFHLTWSEMKSDYTRDNCEVVDYQDFVKSI